MKDFYTQWGSRESLLTLISTSQWIILSILFLMTGQGSGQICNTPNWREYGNNQYLIVNVPGRTWNEAKDYCRSQGGDLAVITSHEQNSFLNTYTLKGEDGYWIGLSDIDGDGKYTWVNNTPSGYSKLRPQGEREGCVVVMAQALQWESLDCSLERLHICQRDSGNLT
ncbi:C-type lectin domain family 4 member F-like [Lytechinus variegatus]|uniref:C-type lectin domain family 4 member F-like n=1 Tax=Lytechinus variegatus TaxID=7654 RepID=UPI001BB288CC|nr:C-type lectin domain family 4 member F-like [Lytechinus variegatus]